MLSHIPVICALLPPQLSNDKPLPQVCWQQTTCNSPVLFSFPSSFPCPSRKHLSAVSFCPHSSSGCSPGSVILWRISILGWVFGLPHCSDPTLWVGGISQIVGLSHRRQTALLNLGRFYPQVVFWVGSVSQKAGKRNSSQGLGVNVVDESSFFGKHWELRLECNKNTSKAWR